MRERKLQRVYYVEDDQDIRALVKMSLERIGHLTVETEPDPFRAIQGIRTFQPDLILLDWMIPDKSGTEVLAWIRANLKERVPVVFVTARDAEEDIVSVLQAGADDYMVKPLRKAELLARINAVVRRTRPEKEDDVVEFWYVDHLHTGLGPYGEFGLTVAASHKDGSGKTWKAAGLADTKYITALLIDPKNPDIVYVGSYPLDSVGMIKAINEVGFKPKIFGGGKLFDSRIAFVDETGPKENRRKRMEHHNQYWGPLGRNLPEDALAAELRSQ